MIATHWLIQTCVKHKSLGYPYKWADKMADNTFKLLKKKNCSVQKNLVSFRGIFALALLTVSAACSAFGQAASNTY